MEPFLGNLSGSWLTIPGLALVMLMSLFYALWKGWLVPGSIVDRMTQQWEARLAESRQREVDWKETSEKERETARIAIEQVNALMSGFSTLEMYVRAIPAAAREIHSDKES